MDIQVQGSSQEADPESPEISAAKSVSSSSDEGDEGERDRAMMAQRSLEALNPIFLELRSKSEEIRLRASYGLRDQVVVAHRDLPTDKFLEYYNTVNQRISQLVVQSNDTAEKLGGILAIEQLITFDGDDPAQKTTHFSNYLRAALRSNDNAVLVFAARALGHLAIPGGALTAELVEAEIQSALEWLQTDRQETRRFAAVLVIRELARNSPTLLYAFVPQIFDCILVALRDPKVLIRETAAEAAGACFEIIAARDAHLRQQWFDRIYDDAIQGFKSQSADTVHGSLLTVKELLLKGGMFMRDHHKEACELNLRLKDHRDPRIRGLVVTIIPILAGYSPETFSSLYLFKFMTFLQGQLKKDKERNPAFIAIGKVAHAVGSAIAPFLDGIIVFVREGLSVKARNRVGTDEAPVFQCLSMLSIAIGMALTKYMEALLDPMFACGLSEPLMQALVDMAHYVHPVKSQIQEKLLNLLSIVLAGRQFRPLGCPENRLPPFPAFAKDFHTSVAERSDKEIELALSTLGSFDFTGHGLNEFIRDVAMRYTDSSNPKVRKASALTCCQLLIRDPIIYQTSWQSLRVVGDVITRLVSLGVADPDPNIRYTMLSALDERFDKHLGKPENIRSLFLAINDSNFEVRRAAIIIVGRLTAVNPAHVFPPLRKVIINLVMSIRDSKVIKCQEDGAKLLGLIMGKSSKLTRAYCEPLAKVLLPQARDRNTGVASTAITAIGQLAITGGTTLEPYISEIMPIVVEALQDLSSPRKRDAALHTLGQLASNSGYVIKPYTDYPQLLDILINIIKTEQQGSLRKETIKLIGTLGALDPYKHQQILDTSPEIRLKNEAETVSDVGLVIEGITPSNEDYYPKVVFTILTQTLLTDPSLSQYHSAVIEALVNIFKTLGLKCIQHLPQIIPSFVVVIRSAPLGKLDAYFNQLAILVSIVRNHIRNFVPQLVEIIEVFWSISSSTQGTVLSLVEAMSRALEGEFEGYITRLLPLLLGVLEHDSSNQHITTKRVLHTILVFGQNAEKHMHMIVPGVVSLFQKHSNPTPIRKMAIETIGKITRVVNISDYASSIVHSLAEIFSGKELVLKTAALDCICAYIFQLGEDYLIYTGTINKALVANHVPHQNYNILVSRLQKGEPLPQDLSPDEYYGGLGDDSGFADIGQKKLPVNQEHLKNAWEASQKSTPEDWHEWIRRFSVELLKESPSHALRACAGLAGLYQPLAKELFNSAFASCWPELYDQYQEELIRSLEIALTSPSIPPEILQVLLNLCEFMEHDDKALPIDIRTLGQYAGRNHAYAKALHYKELEFEEEKTPSTVEALISINNQLQQTDAAVGILRNAQKYRDIELKETWYEKLERWDEALEAYRRREKDLGRDADDNTAFEILMGKMRCLHALGEWDQLSTLAEQRWNLASLDHKRTIAPLATAAAWGLQQWELMDNYLETMKSTSTDRSWFSAILSIQRSHFDQASAHIEKARDDLDKELYAMLNESYTRAYGVVVRVQMLAELEEIIIYKKSQNDKEKQATMRDTWNTRLKGCQPNIDVWQRMLKVRALVLSPADNLNMWIKFANLCRKSGRIGLAEKTLKKLQDNQDPRQATNILITTISGGQTGTQGTPIVPEVAYAQLKYQWATGQQPASLHQLRRFTADLSQQLDTLINPHAANTVNGNNVMLNPNGQNGAGPRAQIANVKMLLAKCYVKQGQWMTTMMRGDWESTHVREVIEAYGSATMYHNQWYKAWHAWALANFEVVTAATARAKRQNSSLPSSLVADHVVPAVQGFLKSIALSSSSSLQDTLRLLTLWFAHGGDQQVNTVILEGFNDVSMDTWLEVIPQLIARINQPVTRVRTTIHRLLVEIGKVHPQALIFPLTVTMKSNVARRSESAGHIMEKMREHSPLLVQQADLVSHELIRVAVLWHELWHEGLEEASRLYFGDHDIDGMFATLNPLHDLLAQGAETLREMSFAQSFGRDLHEAQHWCNIYRQTGETGDLNQAWDLYYSVFKRIARQLPNMISLDLVYVSPRLKAAKNLDLAVPGTYQSGKPIISISNFTQMMSVIPSKQRPRRMSMQGSDGVLYEFCLKGHEDIRQDERVMQLFGLVNTLLNHDGESFKRHLNIQRYPAIPLSQQSGLLGWVPNSDTMHNLIKEYREHRRILLNIEHRIMLQMAPDYDNLTLMQKVEVFSYAMDNTTGKDLYRVLWLKSKSSESWLERRTNYTRSLATMSMVGYILGLGDRHPSNLMIDRITGKVIHIDFGDCFEVAMHREKYPERVPFRLTRMLTFAMEVSNIDGSYKISSEAVMRVIRDNKESLMAVLEAFIHDPLLNWRLGSRESPHEPSFPSERRQSIVGDLETAQQERPRGNSYRVRRLSALQAGVLDAQGGNNEDREVQNARAVQVLNRVKDKLMGNDFKADQHLSVEQQVAKLVAQATNVENLCQHYIGWCSFW
ncbi:phosphatidylinositol kinase-related protein kinase tor1 [Lecanora helva]